MWLYFDTQAATFLFYAVTGYKFRPMNANPYLLRGELYTS